MKPVKTPMMKMKVTRGAMTNAGKGKANGMMNKMTAKTTKMQSKAPSYSKVAKSVRKTMGYK